MNMCKCGHTAEGSHGKDLGKCFGTEEVIRGILRYKPCALMCTKFEAANS